MKPGIKRNNILNLFLHGIGIADPGLRPKHNADLKSVPEITPVDCVNGGLVLRGAT